MSAARSPICFFFDEVARAFRVAKVPSQRGDEAAGFLQGCSRWAPSKASARSCTAPPSAPTRCLSGAGPRIGVITTRGFRDVLEMRRRDRPADLGLVGRVRPDRRSRSARRSRRAHAGRRHASARRSIEAGVAAAATGAARARRARRSRSSSSTPTPTPRTSAARSPRRAQVWPNEHLSASHQILPEIREFERASTTALNAYLQPVVGTYLGKLEGALAQRISPARSISCSRMAA